MSAPSIWERWTLGVQSVFENAGVNAAIINELAVLLMTVLGASFSITMTALAIAWFARASGRWIIWTGG